MLQGAGITDNHTRLLYNGCQNVVSFGGAVIGAIFKDRWGRRRGLLVSTTGTVVICYIITALNATNTYTAADSTILAKSPASSKAEIASIFIFGFVYSAGWTPLQALYPVNVLRYESREKGIGFYNFWDCLEAAVIYLFLVRGDEEQDLGGAGRYLQVEESGGVLVEEDKGDAYQG